jgi:undecaprenyl-diphosphatase
LTLLSAALLGIVQGITEFLPVSSTAHLLLAERALGYQDPGGVFTVMIQLGSILAVMWLYRAKIVDVLAGLRLRRDARHFAAAIAVATVPALFLGGLLSGPVKRVLYNSPQVFAVAFIVGGVVMLIVERIRPVPTVGNAQETPLRQAFAIGVGQAMALIPGVSRSGATIVTGMMLGLDRAAAAEFSFFLAMPVMTAAFAHDLLDVRHQLSPDRAVEIAVGLVMAFISSLLIIRPFLRYVGRAGFAPFGWYRIALGGLLLVAMAAGWITR